MTATRAAWLAGGVMLAVYVATLAPSVTFWDAGEFIAAARTLGIPHPPGTPLFILPLNVWARAWSFLPFAVATNLFSAACTAAAVGLTALWIGRMSVGPVVALSAITAGAMTSVWQNATETEVYAASLALSVVTIVAADTFARSDKPGWLVLTSYLLALSVPLHVSALVAAPVVIYLVTERPDGTRDWRAGMALTGVSACAMGLSRLSAPMVAAGAALVVASVFGTGGRRRTRFATVAPILLSVAVAFSALLFMLVRARHDPAINQGNPSTWSDLAYVIGRRQYDVQGMWPRQAPIWAQVANWFEYADWQFALSLGPTVIPTVWRVTATLGFAALGVVGSGWHRRVDRRGWTAVLLLLTCGTLGVTAYLNLKAGASFGWGFVPKGSAHEARDRDYFFVLGFWAWGIWAGMGAIAAVRRLRWPSGVGVAVAALPIVLNWSAVSRRAEPEASLPSEVARALLVDLPPRAVLFVSGDNDTYPLWYAQQVERTRRDVTIVTLPLLAAAWNGEELNRRDGLGRRTGGGLSSVRAEEVAASARRAGRPVAVATTVPAADRNRIGDDWKVTGITLVPTTPVHGSVSPSSVVRVDTAVTRASAVAIDRWRRGRVVHPALDPVHEYFLNVLSCADLALVSTPSRVQLASLDSTCNHR